MEECGCNVEECVYNVEECGCNIDVMWNIMEECGCFAEQCGCNVDTPHLTCHNLTKSSLLLGRLS